MREKGEIVITLDLDAMDSKDIVHAIQARYGASEDITDGKVSVVEWDGSGTDFVVFKTRVLCSCLIEPNDQSCLMLT